LRRGQRAVADAFALRRRRSSTRWRDGNRCALRLLPHPSVRRKIAAQLLESARSRRKRAPPSARLAAGIHWSPHQRWKRDAACGGRRR